ncbi:MAG: hypothetical protein IKZ88_01655 [Neisseriaceae bacterium]|nr:hypothetical protein [Neisseriaceae bacterium]
MAIDFENDNPYAPPQSSGEITYDGNINSSALQYLNSASKWALFYAVMTVLFLVLALFSISGVGDIFGLIINFVISGFLAFYSWKYAQNAKSMQSNANIEQLTQGTQSLNMILIINGVLFIIGLVILCIIFLGVVAVAVSGGL